MRLPIETQVETQDTDGDCAQSGHPKHNKVPAFICFFLLCSKPMLKIAVGHSDDPDSLEASYDVLAQCQTALDGATPQAGILFAAIDFDHQLILNRVNEAFPGIELIGGTTDGEVSSVLGFQQDSLTLMLFCSDDIEICAAVGRKVSQDPEAIAQQTIEASKAKLKTPPCLCIAIPESLTTSTSLILQGLKTALGNVPVFGGATADQTKMECTYQFYKTEVLSNSVPLLLFGGGLLFSHGISSGWSPIGKRSTVTKVEHNTIYEIDGEPALNFYHYYLNDFVPDAAYPLAVFPPGEETFFLRGAIGYDQALGSITVSGDVPEQSTVQITEAAQTDIISASKTAFDQALKDYPGIEPAAALFFSCAWRRWILGTQTELEYDTIAKSLIRPLPSCGFYTYGEISPLRAHGPAFIHNTTFVTLLFGSR